MIYYKVFMQIQFYSRSISWTAWIVASIFYAYQYVLRVMPSIMMEDMMSLFGVGASAFGQFSGIYYIGYCLVHLPVGILLDRLGPRKVMSICMLMSALGLVPLLFKSHFFYPMLGRFLMGIGSSGAILGVFKIIRMSFEERRFARMLSISVTIGLIGAIYGGGPVSYLKEVLGYQTTLIVFMVAGLFLAFITSKVVPNVESKKERSIFLDLKEVLQEKKVIGSCLFAGLMVGPLVGFADVWGATFLRKV